MVKYNISMKKNFAKNVVDKIFNTIGKGVHQLHEPTFAGNETKYLKQVIKDRFVSSVGPWVNKFEKKISQITKAKFSIAIVNGTEALKISLIASGIKKNQEVLVPALTFVGTVNAISDCGAEPHFIDSEISTMGVDAEKLDAYLTDIVLFNKNKDAINKKTKKIIKGIIPVHIFGHSCDIKKIIKIAKKFNLVVIEDAAEALGSYYNNKHLGTFGLAGCISFNGNKIVTTGGGGVVITNNKKLALRIRHLSTTAKISHPFELAHDSIGYNLRLPGLNAALGVAQLEQLNSFVKAKRKLFFLYNQSFKKIKNIKLFKEPIKCKSNYWLQTLILNKKESIYRNDIIKLCHKKNFFVRPAWKIISKLKPYNKNQRMNLSGAEEIYKRVINIPSSQSLILGIK